MNSPEHEVGDESEEGKEGNVHPPHPQQADTFHPAKVSGFEIIYIFFNPTDTSMVN